mgnify:CR=1 FL=1
MIVVVIVAIFAAIAIPAYQEYARRAHASETQQEMQRLAVLLDRYKARNFSYKGFSTTTATAATTSSYPYTITIVDPDASNATLTSSGAIGRNWVMKATTADEQIKIFDVRIRLSQMFLIQTVVLQQQDQRVGNDKNKSRFYFN